MNIPCPRCGYSGDSEEYVLTEQERRILDTLRSVRKSPLSPVHTRVIADFIGYSPQMVKAHLMKLKRHGIVSLPRGRCSGWVEGDVLREMARIIEGCSHIT